MTKKNRTEESRKMNFITESNFGWERPIENEILDYTRHMAKGMERTASHNRQNGLFGTSLFANNNLSGEALSFPWRSAPYPEVPAHGSFSLNYEADN